MLEQSPAFPTPEARVRFRRLTLRRSLAGAAAVLLVCAAGSCGGTPASSGQVFIPTGDLSAYDQCMLDAGFEIVGVHSTGPGEAPEYDFRLTTTGLDPDEVQARIHQCEVLQPSHPPLTEAEIRQTYDRWVGEYHCMMGLGYQPDPPPSFETFLASYDAGNHKSPWMPTDGIDTAHWTQAQYDEAKAKCSLEFFTMEW
jgi:hypothetical protein